MFNYTQLENRNIEFRIQKFTYPNRIREYFKRLWDKGNISNWNCMQEALVKEFDICELIVL